MDREERRRRREENARQWEKWLRAAMDQGDVTAAELARRSGGRFNTSHVAHWLTGANTANMEAVLLICQILQRDPVEALRAAGYRALADQVHGLVEEALFGEQLLNARDAEQADEPPAPEIVDLLQQVSQAVARHGEILAAQQRAIGEIRDEIDEVRADVDAVTGEVGITDRALRGHIDDPRAHEYPDSDY